MNGVPEALRGRDPDFIRRTLPLWGAVLPRYFRADVRGLENVPEAGPVLLVGNHSGGNVPPDMFLSRGEALAHALRLDRTVRLKVMPISLALPWGVDVGDLLGHLPLPAKIAIRVLEPIDLGREFGAQPDFDVVYDAVLAGMQTTLGALARQRRFPVLG